MITLTLQRLTAGAAGTFGQLYDFGLRELCVTCERPWADNQPEVSCIPHGWYLMQRVHSPRFGETFEVLNVPGRTHILFHTGNTINDTRGCILPGTHRGELHGKPAVLDSRGAFTRLLDYLADVDTARLDVRPAPATYLSPPA